MRGGFAASKCRCNSLMTAWSQQSQRCSSGCHFMARTWRGSRCLRVKDAPPSELRYRIILRSDVPGRIRRVLQSRAPARARCVYKQTSQACSLACPGRVPGAHAHLAHLLGALWPPVSRLAHTQKQILPSLFCEVKVQNV